MKNHKFILALSTSVSILVLLQSCTFRDKLANQKAIADSHSFKSIEIEPTPEMPRDPLAEFDMVKSDRLTDTARFLAGMKIEHESNFAERQNTINWLEHQRFFANAWSKLEMQQLSRVRQWSAEELDRINTAFPSVFYPFGGADFLYAYSLFPQGKEYILVGLEPVGSVPDLATLSKPQLSDRLQKIRDSLYSLLPLSSFPINHMKVDLQEQGVLPILYVFMARTNNRILDVQYVGLDKQANIQTFREGMIPGVKIAFVSEREIEPRTLYYFSADLSNDGLQQHPELINFISQLENLVTYLKAASYLMYSERFSKIKDLLLSQSNYLLQDDSGMPLKSFDSSQWDLTFYGNYTRPISLFSNRYQPELQQIYLTDDSIKPLNFNIGYQFKSNECKILRRKTTEPACTSSNLMLAKVRKDDSLVRSE
ncbi:hypothetical protein IQ238_15215 [Pleurocapsales cyanobacterium LEGE 06147]|nr:hypothetical protein [Pleurocapsales cyanobacterium LEGE 06147]